MDKSPSVIELLRTEDPLSDLACKFLLEYKEEDSHVDYKRDFEPSSEKCWYDLAIDVMAFANTHGGYLVYGVEARVGRNEHRELRRMCPNVDRWVTPLRG
jgi:hypothetical protein